MGYDMREIRIRCQINLKISRNPNCFNWWYPKRHISQKSNPESHFFVVFWHSKLGSELTNTITV